MKSLDAALEDQRRDVMASHRPDRRHLASLFLSDFTKFFAAIALSVIATTLAALWSIWVGDRGPSLLYVAAVSIAGFRYGLWPAIVCAVFGFGLYNFFIIEPVFAFKFGWADLLALSSYVSIAVLIGVLSAQAADRARLAEERTAALADLFEASKAMSAASTTGAVLSTLVDYIGSRNGHPAAAWLIGSNGVQTPAFILVGGEAEVFDGAATEIADMLLHSHETFRSVNGFEVYLLSSGRDYLGAVAVRPPAKTRSNQAEIKHLTLVDLATSAIQRVRLADALAEEELNRARDELRSALLSSLSHDLRTPLASIYASATSLKEHASVFDEVTKSELIGLIESEVARMNRYVDHLLSMSRLEAGALAVSIEAVDLPVLVSDVVNRIASRLKGRSIEFQSNEADLNVLADPVLLEQALTNLLENACAHTPQNARVTVEVTRSHDVGTVAVIDTGPGIPFEYREQIFERFFRAGSDRSAKGDSGVGLGLAVARGLVVGMGGQLSLVSQPPSQSGAKFLIALPVFKGASQDAI